MTQPLISIVIAAYNIENYIVKALQSACGQTYTNIEIIMADDGSTDNTVAQARTVADERIRILTLPHQGLLPTRKPAVEAAKGEYLTFLDGDDILTPDCVEILYKCIAEQHTDIAIARAYRHAPAYTILIDEPKHAPVQGELYTRQILTNETTPSVWAKLYKKELFNGLDYPADISFGEDKILNLQIALKNINVAYVDKPVYYYVKRTDSITHDALPLEYVIRLTDRIETLCANKPTLKPWTVMSKIMYYLININSSRNPDVSQNPWVKKIYQEIKNHKTLYKHTFQHADRVHISLYQHNITKPIARSSKILRRLGASIKKRISTHK